MKYSKTDKQIALKPQDIFVAAKIAITELTDELTFASLGSHLLMSPSEVHAAVQRAEGSDLIKREYGQLSVNRTSLAELLIHGVRYVFPPMFGQVTRGVATSVSAAPLSTHFGDAMPLVWPHPSGEQRGLSLCPIYPTVPAACLLDRRLHEIMALIDALRAGAARERELAREILPRHLN